MSGEDLDFTRINSNDFILIDQLNSFLYGRYPVLNSKVKLNTTYSKHKNLGILVKTKNGDLVSSYLVFPLQINYFGNLIWVCQAGNTMLNPSYTGRNIVVKCGLLVYEILKDLNYQAVFGIPSRNILRTRLKLLKWEKNTVIHNYNIFVPTIPVFLLSRKISAIESMHKSYVKFLSRLFFKRGDYFDASDKNIESGNNVFIERTAEYWKYKLQNTDILLLRSGKTNFVLKISRELYLGDIDLKDGFPNLYFKIKLLIFAICSFNASIRFFCTKGAYLEKFLTSFSNPKESLSYCSKIFDSSLDIKELKFTYFDFDTF